MIGVDISSDAGAELESELTSEGFDFQFRTVDVSSEEQVNQLAAEVTTGRLVDIVYNNAGIILGKHILDPPWRNGIASTTSIPSRWFS